MKLLFRNILVAGAILLTFSTMAWAELDIVGTYSYSNATPADLNTINQANLGSSFPSHTKMGALGADAIYYLPIAKLGLGLRYESWSNKVSGSGYDQTLTASRTALLIGYRIINMPVYLGLIGSYGIAHTMKATTTNGYSDLTPASVQSYSVGVDGGIKFGMLLFGGELGYLSQVGKDIKNSQSNTSVLINGAASNINLAAPYFKVRVGLAI